jgi:hypothetical protein
MPMPHGKSKQAKRMKFLASFRRGRLRMTGQKKVLVLS